MSSEPKSSILIGRPPETPEKTTPLALRGAALGGAACLLGGCGLEGAPSYSVFGAFFPAWLLCAGVGIAGSVGLRTVLLAAGLERTMPLKPLVYLAFATVLALSLWLLLFWMS